MPLQPQKLAQLTSREPICQNMPLHPQKLAQLTSREPICQKMPLYTCLKNWPKTLTPRFRAPTLLRSVGAIKRKTVRFIKTKTSVVRWVVTGQGETFRKVRFKYLFYLTGRRGRSTGEIIGDVCWLVWKADNSLAEGVISSLPAAPPGPQQPPARQTGSHRRQGRVSRR